MNKLQNIDAPIDFCVSVNNDDIDTDKVLGRYKYSHPSFLTGTDQAKRDHCMINGQQNTFFVGAYWRNGFHEDGVFSSIKALKPLGVSL